MHIIATNIRRYIVERELWYIKIIIRTNWKTIMNMEAVNGNLDIDENHAVEIPLVMFVRKFFKTWVILEYQG